LIDKGLTSREPGESWVSDVRGATGRRKAATEIMPDPARGCGGVFIGECVTAGDCGSGRERCAKVGLGGISGGVRKGGLLTLDSEGEADCPTAILDGGRWACWIGSEETDAKGGDEETLLVGGCSEELRGACGEPGTRPRVRAKGDEG